MPASASGVLDLDATKAGDFGAIYQKKPIAMELDARKVTYKRNTPQPAAAFMPPPPQPPQPGGGLPGGGPPAPQAAPAAPDLVNMAMKLTPQQLALLPPDRRAKMEMLREKIRQGQFGGAAAAAVPPPPGSELL